MEPRIGHGTEPSPSEDEGGVRQKLLMTGAATFIMAVFGLVIYLNTGETPVQQSTTTSQASTSTSTTPSQPHDPTTLSPLWRAVEELEAAYPNRVERVKLARAVLNSLTEESGERLDPQQVDEPVPRTVPPGFEEVWRTWRQLELSGLDMEPRALVVKAIEAMVDKTGDPEAAVLVDVTVQPDGYVENALYGIGAFVRSFSGLVVVSQPFPGGPASKAGIRPGDVIVAVDGVSVAGMDINEVADRVRGPAGTTVSLVLERAGADPVRVEVTRETLQLGTARFTMLPGGIGYLAVTSLEARTPAEVNDHLRQLMQRDTQALILDLRGNSGGRPSAAVAVADQFLDRELVYVEEDLGGASTAHYAKDGGLGTEIPLAILIDDRTANEAELLAAALRYYHRGPLLGSPSSGENTLHRGHALGNGVVIVTRSGRWLIPNGDSVSDRGLVPDHEVELTREDIASGFDRQKSAANAYLWNVLESASDGET